MVSRIFIFFFVQLFSVTLAAKPVNYQYTANRFIEAIRNGEDTKNYIEIFRYANHEELKAQLETDEQKKTFWINVYNGFIQVILSKNPEKYNDRGKFFKEKQINIGGEMVSFADIEHGILRRSQHDLLLGYWVKWFPPAFEKKFRVDRVDYRIHFALNCGARSCPPIAVYDIDRIEEQLNKSTESYLSAQTRFDAGTGIAYSTSLFAWFRGDFGGLAGIKNILYNLGLIPDRDVRIKTTTYDWTLALNQFVDI